MSHIILVIDDSLTIRRSLQQLLTSKGFEVLLAEDGRLGAEQIAANEDIELVVCDVNMPRMNGLQTLKWVRGRSATKDLPFLLLTTEKKKAMVQEAREYGASGWVVKPFQPDLLVSTIRKLVA